MNAMSRDMRERLAREHMEKARSMKTDTTEQMEDAVHHLTLAVTLNPFFTNALLLRAHLAAKLGHYNMAVVDFSIVIQLEEYGLDRRRLGAAYGSRGGVYRKMNKITESIIDLSRAAEVEPDNGTWLYELGLSYLLQGGNFALAQHFFSSSLGEKVAGRMSDNVRFRALSQLGTCKLNLGDFNGAEAVFMKGLEVQETAHLHNLLGITRFLREEYKTAMQSFYRVLEMDSFNSGYCVNMGICLFQLGLMPDALKYFEDAVLKGTKNPLHYMFRGNTSLVLDLHQQALMDVNEAIALEPSRDIFHYAKALVLIAQEIFDEALAELATVLQLNPDFRTAQVHSALLHFLKGDLFASLKCFTQALQLNEVDELVHEWVGLVYFDLHYYDLAAESFTRCICLNPTNPVFHFRRGTALIKHGDIHGAYVDLHKAVHELRFSEPRALHCFSVVLSQLGRHVEALEIANAALLQKKSCHYLLHRARCHYILGDHAAVVEDASCILHLGHEVAEVYYMRAQSQYVQHAFQDAVNDLLLAARLQPKLHESADYCYALGAAYLHTGHKEAEAEAAFTRAIGLHPQPPSFFFDERAKARQQLGDARGMLEDLHIVLRGDENNPTALLRRSLAYKALHLYDASARDFERVKSLSPAGEMLARVSYENFFSVDCMTWDLVE